MMRHTRTQHRPASQQVNDHGRVSGTHRPGGRCGWVQCRAMRRRRQRNSVSGVTSHPARVGRGSAAAIAASRLRSVSVSSGRSTCRRSTVSWWRNTMISRSLERPERTVSRASDARNRYKIRYTRTQHRPASRQVNDHGRVSGTHRVKSLPTSGVWLARIRRPMSTYSCAVPTRSRSFSAARSTRSRSICTSGRTAQRVTRDMARGTSRASFSDPALEAPQSTPSQPRHLSPDLEGRASSTGGCKCAHPPDGRQRGPQLGTARGRVHGGVPRRSRVAATTSFPRP